MQMAMFLGCWHELFIWHLGGLKHLGKKEPSIEPFVPGPDMQMSGK